MSKEKEELKQEEEKVKATNAKRTSRIKQIREKEEKTKKLASDDSITKKETSESVDTTKTKTTSKESSKAKEKTTSTPKKVNNTKTSDSNSKVNSSEKENSSKNEKKVVENKEVIPNNEKKAKEETIIEKIKSFIAKIVAMQEEAKNEELAKKEKKKETKKAESEEKTKDTEKVVYLTEYYDLPYRYNETVVKILAQTPKRMFVYWDVADADRTRYENAFGKDFFEKTYPVLLLHNDDKNYTTEIPINDFANSWYIDINDPKTKYTIQLGRKFREVPKNIDIAKIQEQQIVLHTDYLPIAQSNVLEVPNDHILFEEMPSKIVYRNVKTNEEKVKVVANIQTPYGIVYDVREFYNNNYKEEIDEEIFDLNNPTSGGLSSSSFK